MGSPTCPTCKGTGHKLLLVNRFNPVTETAFQETAGWGPCPDCHPKFEAVARKLAEQLAKKADAMDANLTDQGFWWLAETVEKPTRYIADVPSCYGDYTPVATQARRWRTRTECADYCADSNKWRTLRVEPVQHGFTATPTPPAPADDAGCVCGEPTTKGVVHRTDGPCFHRPGPRWDADPLAPEDHAKCAAERHPADDARPMVTGGGLIKFDRILDHAAGGAGDAGVMRERAASILDEYAKNAATLSKTPPEEGYEDRREEWAGTASMLRALATQMRRLPLPAAPATAVEEARRAFYEAARAFCEEARIAVVTEMLGGRNMIEPTRNVAKPMLGAYDAMLAAEADAKGGARG